MPNHTYSEIGATVTVNDGDSPPTVSRIDKGDYYYFVLKFTNGGKSYTIRFDKETIADILVVGGGSDGINGTRFAEYNWSDVWSAGGNGGEVKRESSMTLDKNTSFDIRVGNANERSNFGTITASKGTPQSSNNHTGGSGQGGKKISTTVNGGEAYSYSIGDVLIGTYGGGGGAGNFVHKYHASNSGGLGNGGAGNGGYFISHSSGNSTLTLDNAYKATDATSNSGGGGGGGIQYNVQGVIADNISNIGNDNLYKSGKGGSGIVILSVRVDGSTPDEIARQIQNVSNAQSIESNAQSIESNAQSIESNLRELYQLSGTNADSANQLYLATMVGGTFWMVLATAMLYYTFTEL